MKYISTRGKSPALDFNEILLAGLAPDGGLYVPEEIPKFSEAEIKDMSSLSYSELAFLLIKPFVGGVIDDSELRTMIFQAYSVYTHKDVAPLVQLSENHWILELFHGPTLAFKDFALQLLGILVEHVLAKTGRRALVLLQEIPVLQPFLVAPEFPASRYLYYIPMKESLNFSVDR